MSVKKHIYELYTDDLKNEDFDHQIIYSQNCANIFENR